jgi:hypothetical protein
MKLTIFLTAIALVPASAQIAPMKPATSTASAAGSAIPIIRTEQSSMSLQNLRVVEKEMDGRIAATGIAATGGSGLPCTVLSGTRGVYVSGLGAVFSAEVELAPTPGGIGIFQSAPGPEQKTKFRKDKLANIPFLEKTLSDMVLSIATSTALKLSDTDQIVVAARLNYRIWEDTNGLPGQIVARLDRRSGTVKVEIQ